MPEPAVIAGNLPEFTVSEISQAVKRTLETSFERVRVRGEVSKPNYHDASGVPSDLSTGRNGTYINILGRINHLAFKSGVKTKNSRNLN